MTYFLARVDVVSDAMLAGGLATSTQGSVVHLGVMWWVKEHVDFFFNYS